jgi:hypothetical protein
MDFRKIGWDGMDWIDLTQDRDQWMALVNAVMNLRGSKNVGKFLNDCTIGSFARWAQLHEWVSDNICTFGVYATRFSHIGPSSGNTSF